jgi:hypothetical protein
MTRKPAGSLRPTESFSPSWQRRSPHPDDDRVLGRAWNWLNALPMGVRPVHLPEKFPRIVNELFRLWARGPALTSYFAEKEFSPREGRTGFPPIIKEELLAMHVYALRNRLAPTPDHPAKSFVDADEASTTTKPHRQRSFSRPLGALLSSVVQQVDEHPDVHGLAQHVVKEGGVLGTSE